jgi:hypothetical protein
MELVHNLTLHSLSYWQRRYTKRTENKSGQTAENQPGCLIARPRM